MSDYNDICKLMHAKLSTAIQHYSTGKFGIVGSIPIECCRKVSSGFGETWTSKVFDTEQEVIDALLAAGTERFQLSDCSWYEA